MSFAAAQAGKFYQQVTTARRVFTFCDDGAYLVFPVDGASVVPFWSSRSRIDRVQALHPKYRSFQGIEIELADFLNNTLVQLGEEQIRIGVNWSGAKLVGYDQSVQELRRNLDYWIAQGRG